MTFDPSTLPAKTRSNYIRLGRQYGSNDTLAQANRTLNAHAAYGAELVKHGFSLDDGARLKDARDGLLHAGAGRLETVGGKKVTNLGYADALREGKDARESARSVAENVARALGDVGGADEEEGSKVIRTALQQTRSVGSDGEALAAQLDVLAKALSEKVVAKAAAGRGGPEAVAALVKWSAALRATMLDRAGAPGTQAATEELDLYDGIIVTLARGARKAARAAAKRLGKPAIAAEFELTELYRSRSRARAGEGEGEGEAPRGDAGGAAPAGGGAAPR